jgi:hypothetical protein
MTRVRLARWAAFALVPLLVGAVLLMHGLDANTTTVSVTSVAAEHEPGHDHDRGCDTCPRPHHVLAACVAVIAAIGTSRAARQLAARVRRSITPAVGRLGRRVGDGLIQPARPPDPASVRFDVMRC